MKICITWNLHLISSANKAETPIAASTRKKKHREGALHRTANALRNKVHAPPYRVTLTRIAKRRLNEHDNLRHAFKHIVDGICDALGVPDEKYKTLIDFDYRQEIGTPEIRIEVKSK